VPFDPPGKPWAPAPYTATAQQLMLWCSLPLVLDPTAGGLESDSVISRVPPINLWLAARLSSALNGSAGRKSSRHFAVVPRSPKGARLFSSTYQLVYQAEIVAATLEPALVLPVGVLAGRSRAVSATHPPLVSA
jgi:hypothetical protein